MPNIETISVPLFSGLDPYFFQVDNIPIEGLIDRVDSVNDAVDNATVILDASVGSAGSLSARLNQSLNQNGSLKTAAVDTANHSIENHTDGATYVRMTAVERSKLAGIASSSTSFQLSIDSGVSGDTTILFDNDTAYFGESDSIAFRNDSGVLRLDYLGTSVVHSYGVIPTTANRINYVTPTDYISGTLRVYVNGIRINLSPTSVYYPTFSGSTVSSWVSLNFTETSSAAGTFAMSTALAVGDKIIVDFDTASF